MALTKVERIGCQVCLENFTSVGKFKSHMRGTEHHKQMAEVFPKGKCSNRGFFCSINVMEYLAKHQPTRLVLGLSMVTVCPNTELRLLLYLCHLCEEICTQAKIMGHLFSPAHLINYYTYTDPDVLSFSWFPGMSMFQDLKPVAIEDGKKNGNGTLQVLDLPTDLFKVIRRLTYASAMSTLEENEKLVSLLKESKPKRISVQSYVADPSRKHALLGLQHLVECVCDGASVKRFHLCTLCQITLRGNAIISHLISFDHVYRYINAWHPSTLKSKHCYTDDNPLFKSSMCHYARQAEERSGTDNSIKQLTVTTEVFNSLEASYSKALDTLETISRECNGRSLITSVQPGEPLEMVSRMSVTSDKGSSKLKERPTKPSYKLRCQNCKINFSTSNYIKHVNTWSHYAELRSIFGSAVEDEDQKASFPYLELFRFVKLSSEEHIIGLPFIVVCICSEAKGPALYLCFACLKCFSDAEVWQHMTSQRHALFTVLQQRVPFAWAYEMDTMVLRQLALEEQQANGGHILKVFDIPYSTFSKLKLTFYHLTKGEELRKVQYHLRNEVPWAPNPKPEHPLLGQDFVVRYSVMHGPNSKEWRFLCLLCGRNLGRKESTAHVLSYEHAQNFLEKAHCGSLDCSDVSREALLDLAEQAEKIHPVSEIQTIVLKEPLLDSVEYLQAVEILQSVKWRQSNCELIPVLAAGKRLVPTQIIQEIGHGHAEEKTPAETEKSTTEGGKSAVNKRRSTSHTPPRTSPPKVEPNSPAATTGGPPGGATNEMKVEEEANTAAPDATSKGPVELQPQMSMGLDWHPAKKIKEEPQMRNDVGTQPSEVAPAQTRTPVNIKQEPLSSVKPEPNDSSRQSLAASPKRENDGEEARVQVGTESSSTQTCTAECKKETAMPDKRKACGRKDQEVGSKRPPLCPKGEPPHLTGMDNGNATEKALLKDVRPTRAQIDQVPASPPASSSKLWDFIKLKDRVPVIGLHALLECHCEPYAPIYLCKCCCLKIPEKYILAHITGVKHQMQYLKLPSINMKRKAIRRAAAKEEQRDGFGEAQVVELTPEVYSEMLQQGYDFALKSVLAFQNTLQRSPTATKVVTSKPDALRPSAVQQPSPTVRLSPTSTTTPLASGTGKTTHVAPQVAQQTENKAASSPTLESSATVKGSGTDATFQSTVTRKVLVPKIGIPAKIPVEKLIPTHPIISVAQSLSLSRSQSRVTFATPLVTSPKSIPSTPKGLTTVSKWVSALKSDKLLGTAASSKIEAQTGDKGQTNHDAHPLPEAQLPSLSVALLPTSSTASLASDPGKTTRVHPKTKVQQTGWPKTKATSSPTLNSGATVTSKSVAPGIGIPAKSPVDEFIPAPPVKPVATSLSISPSQSSVAVVKSPVTSSKSIPSTMNTLTTSSKGVTTPKSVNPLRAATSSKNAAPAVDKVRTNHDASVMRQCTPIPQSVVFSYPQPCTASTEQGLGSASPTTPVYSTSTFPPNHTAVADSSKVKSSSKNQPVVGTGRLVVVRCEKRRQSYCLLCSVRLKNGDHMTSNSHRYKYLKFHSFDWKMEGNSEMDEKRMLTSVTHLAEIEKVQGIIVKTVEVNSENYNRLATVSEEEALAKVKELLESESQSSTSASEAEGPKCVSGSHGASRSADEVDPNPGAKPHSLTGVARAAVKPTPEPARTSPSSARTPVKGGVCDSEMKDRLSIEFSPNHPDDVQVEIVDSVSMEEATICKVEKSDEVPHPIATGSPITHALPSHPRTLEEPEKHITQPDPAPRREPSPGKPMGRPTADLYHSSSANSKHNGESVSESVLQMERKGEKIFVPSDLSTFLPVYCNTEPIIGLAVVFECRALFEETFYLCGSCRKTFSIKDICKHIVSAQHRHTYMLKDYPQFMSWWDEDLPPEKKEELLRAIAWKISEREVYDQMDAQVIMLHKDCYDYIRQAHFIQALDTLQKISREKGLNHLFGYQKQLCPQTSDAPATREPRSDDASMESNTREKDGLPCPINSVPQDTVNSGPTLPVVGIWAIVECSCEGQTPLYLCVACGNRLSRDLVLPHVKGQRHLQVYLAGRRSGPGCDTGQYRLSARYPWADAVGVEPAKLLQLARGLEEQNPDEPSTMQRISLPQEEFSRIRTMTFDQALSRLKTICENQRPSELLTCVTSKPRPALKRPLEDSLSDTYKVKHQRLSSPPADHVTQTPLKSPDAPWPPEECSRLMAREEKVFREASELLLSRAHAAAPQVLHATQPATLSKPLPSPNFKPNQPPASTPVPIVGSMESLTRTQPVERADIFPVSCPHSLSEGNTQAAAVPLVSLTQEHKKGAVPSAYKPFKTGNSILINNAADLEMFSEAGGCSKDETKHAVNHDTGSKASQSIEQCRPEESPKMSNYPVQPHVPSSVPSANNCSAGSFAGAVGRIGVITGVFNTSNPHAEITADPGALLTQEDRGFQGNFRQEPIQTGTNHNSRLQQIRHNQRLLQLLMEPASSHPIGSTGPLAANLSTTAFSSRSASTQNNSHTHNITEETPGITGPQGYSTGQPYYPTTPYHASGYVDYHHPSMPMAVDSAIPNPPLYSANVNHSAVGTHRGGPLNQSPLFGHYVMPTQGQSIVMARGLPQYWPSVTPATAVSHGAMAPSYHGAVFSGRAANYSQGLQSARTFRNNRGMSDPGQPQGTSNLLNIQGFQASTNYGFTSATAARVMTSEGHSQGTAAFLFSYGAGNGTR